MARPILGNLLHRHRIRNDIRPVNRQTDIISIEKYATGLHICQILLECSGIHSHYNLVFLPSCQEAFPAYSDGIPGGQALDIRREQVLSRDRDAHLEQRPKEGEIRGLAPRTIHSGNCD